MSPMSATAAFGDVRRIAHGPMRRLFIGELVKSLGNGLTLALLMVYLTRVRHLAIPVATGLLAWQAILALLLTPIAGTLIDRFGPRPVLLAAALTEAVGVLGYGHVTDIGGAVVTTTIVAIGGAGLWGSGPALVARLVGSQDRSAAFGFQFMLTNLGLGLGGLIGAAIVDEGDPSTFTLLYTLSALAYVALFLAVLSMGRVGGLPVVAEPVRSEADGHVAADDVDDATTPAGGGWREVLRDRALLRYAVAGMLMLTFGYASIDSGVSLYVRNSVGLPVNVVGVIFAANTLVIVLAQMFVLGFIKGRSRTRALAGVGVLWAVSWVLFASALGAQAAWAQLIILVLAMAVFAIGETLWSPVAPALLNDLAPEHLRGRYNAVQSLLFGASGAIGPLVTGLFLSAGHGLLWALTLGLSCAVAALIILRLRPHLTAVQDGLGEPPEAARTAIPV